jgi:cytidylate kinase
MKGPAGARSRLVIAMDGPSGVGKTTVARAVAARLGYSYVESGAMYRAIALLALENGIASDDAAALGRLAAAADIRFVPSPEGNRLLLNGRDVTDAIRSPEVTRMSSFVSTHAAVRARMVERQRVLGAAGGVVMEGRDIGTVVFPDADLKIFLDAAPQVRGQRRLKDMESAPHSGAESVLNEITERDQRDQTRAVSPLAPAADAVRVDTTHLTAEQVVEQVLKLAESKQTAAASQKRPAGR